jgi:hypothetical protein
VLAHEHREILLRYAIDNVISAGYMVSSAGYMVSSNASGHGMHYMDDVLALECRVITFLNSSHPVVRASRLGP